MSEPSEPDPAPAAAEENAPVAETAAGGELEDAGEVPAATGGEEAPAKPGGLARWLVIRDRPGGAERLLLGLGCIAMVLLVWWALALENSEEERYFINAYALPSPGDTFASFKSLWFDRALARAVVASLGRVLGGFFLAAAVAVPLGVLAGCYLRLDAFLRPFSVFGRSVPIAALIPLTLIWFGLGEIQKVLFIFLASVAFILFDSTAAAASVSNRFLDTAYTLGARDQPRRGAMRALSFGIGYALLFGLAAWFFTRATHGFLFGNMAWWWAPPAGFLLGFALWFPIQSSQPIHMVLYPLALPRIVNSLRLLFGLAFGYIMLAEVINAKAGLGSIIIISQRQGPREHIYLILILIALLAFAIDRTVFFLQRRWFPYEENAYS